jgi:hypothetical protein
MPRSDRGAETTERTHEAELPRLRAPASQASTAFPASQLLQTERTSLADDALFVLDGPGVAGGSTIGTFNGHLLTALGGGGGRGANNYPAVTHAQDPRPRTRSNVFSIDLCKGVSR